MGYHAFPAKLSLQNDTSFEKPLCYETSKTTSNAHQEVWRKDKRKIVLKKKESYFLLKNAKTKTRKEEREEKALINIQHHQFCE